MSALPAGFVRTWNSVGARHPERIRLQVVDGVVSHGESGGAVHPGEGSGLHPGDGVTHNVQHLQMTQTAEGGRLDGVNTVSPHLEFPQFDQFVKSSSFHCGDFIVQKLQVH